MDAPGTGAVITGGEGDLAQVIAAQLSNRGLRVETPGRTQLDVSNRDAVEAYFKGREFDLLVCNAGITRDQPLISLTEKNWDDVVDVNLKGAVRCVRAAVEPMKRRGGGSIILISSHSALHPPVGQSAYATAKASLLGLVCELSHELGEHNIRINAILPGYLETRMTESVTETRKQQVVEQHVLKRLNTCKEVAAFICLLHQELIHTSGQIFQLDSRNAL